MAERPGKDTYQDLLNRQTSRNYQNRHQSLHGMTPDVSTVKRAVQTSNPNDLARLHKVDPNAPLSLPAEKSRYLPLRFTMVLPYVEQAITLTMYVNPTQMTISMQKKITREKTIAGYAEFHWGDELTGISCEAVTGAFQDPATGLLYLPHKRNNDYIEGNQFDSPAGKEFEKLLLLFKNNGVYWATGSNPAYAGNFDQTGYVDEVGHLYLEYDGKQYNGHFETFSWTEDQANPHMLSFNFEFKSYPNVRPDQPSGIIGNFSGLGFTNQPQPEQQQFQRQNSQWYLQDPNVPGTGLA